MAKLTEELVGSAKEVMTYKEEAQKEEILLRDIQSQLSSKSQGLEDANNTIKDLKARIDTMEISAVSSGAREQQLTKDMDTSRRLGKDVEDKLENHSEQVDI